MSAPIARPTAYESGPAGGPTIGAHAPLEEFAYLMRTRGYFVLENAISDASLLADLRRGIDRTMDEDAERARSGHYENFTNENISRSLVSRGNEFVRLLDESRVQPHIDRLLTDTCTVFNYTGVRLMPGIKNSVSTLHRDSSRYSPGYMLLAQVLYFVDEFTSENGATWILPGSHQCPDVISEEFFRRHAIQVTGKAGSALIFDSMLWHLGGTNRTQEPRRGVALVYARSFMKQMLDMPRIIPRETAATLSPLVKRLMGFNVRVPTSLEEFYVSPEKRLYKANQG